MSLTIAHTGDVIYSSTINQCISILQRKHGQSEVGHYWISGNSYTTSTLYQSVGMMLISRNSTPVSISIDTADGGPNNLLTPLAGHLKAGITQIYAKGTAISPNVIFVGGNWTVQY